MNPEERRRKQLERIERQRQMMSLHLERHRQQLEHRREQMEARFARAAQRLGIDSSEPSDEQQRIIMHALKLLDEVGLNDLSLRKLAATLDLKAPALYWYFKNKDALIDYMAEAILAEEFRELTPRSDDESWQDWLVATCQRLRHAMLSYRDGARVVAGAHFYPAVTLMRLSETSLQSLTSAGLEVKQASLIISTAVHFVFGNVIEEQASPTLEEVERIDMDTLKTHYPLMGQSIEQTIEIMQCGHDEFEDSLRLIVNGAPVSGRS